MTTCLPKCQGLHKMLDLSEAKGFGETSLKQTQKHKYKTSGDLKDRYKPLWLPQSFFNLFSSFASQQISACGRRSQRSLVLGSVVSCLKHCGASVAILGEAPYFWTLRFPSWAFLDPDCHSSSGQMCSSLGVPIDGAVPCPLTHYLHSPSDAVDICPQAACCCPSLPGCILRVSLCLPFADTFASKVAATQDQYADASIGNVTGSNAVNVFLGIGVAWSIAAIYHAAHGQAFQVSPGTLAFSVTLFTIFAFISVGVLLYRRRPEIGGELGGPRTSKLLTSSLFILLWLLYIFFSSLEAYCHIKGF